MRKIKLFKSLTALVLAVTMTFSGVSFVNAAETQDTDKSKFDIVFENEADVKYLSEEEHIAIVEAMYGKSISEMPDLTMSKYAKVHIVDDDTVFSIDWDNSEYSEEDVTAMYISTYLWYEDENGDYKYALCYNEATEDMETLYRLGIDNYLSVNAKGEYNIRDNFGYSLEDFVADGGDESSIDAAYEGTIDMDDVAGLNLLAKWYLGVGINYTIGEPMNSTDNSSWKSPQPYNSVIGGGCYSLDSFFDNNMFLAPVFIEYTDSETGESRVTWTYIASESAIASENNPFTYLDEKPSDEENSEAKTGLFKNAETGEFEYYVDGKLASDYTGVVENAGYTWYVINGILDSSYTGIRYDGTDFWYIINGKVNTDFVGLYNFANAWWYVKDGKIQADYKGMIDYSGHTWYVANGKVDTGFTGLGLHNGTWYCVQAGKVNMSYSGLVLNGGSWWYVTDGILDTGVTGIVETGGSQWLVGTGKLQSTYTGSYINGGVTYSIVNGKVVN